MFSYNVKVFIWLIDLINLFIMDSSARFHGSGIFWTDTGQGVSFAEVVHLYFR